MLFWLGYTHIDQGKTSIKLSRKEVDFTLNNHFTARSFHPDKNCHQSLATLLAMARLTQGGYKGCMDKLGLEV